MFLASRRTLRLTKEMAGRPYQRSNGRNNCVTQSILSSWRIRIQDAAGRRCGDSGSDPHRFQVINKLPAALEANDIRGRFRTIRFIDRRYRASHPLMAAIEDIQLQFGSEFPLQFLQKTAGPRCVFWAGYEPRILGKKKISRRAVARQDAPRFWPPHAPASSIAIS
jgi:hypothetical protein